MRNVRNEALRLWKWHGIYTALDKRALPESIHYFENGTSSGVKVLQYKFHTLKY